MIIWSDDSLLVVNKPPELRTIPDGYDLSLPTLHGILQAEWGKLWVVHRLDKDTSGVILFARNAEAHKSLNTQFEHHQVKKEYHALVIGYPDWDSYCINLPLKVNGDRRHRTICDPGAGKPASTSITVLQRFTDFSLLQAVPTTGYTHQIRAHLSSIGFPLIGDSLYRYPNRYTGPRLENPSLPVFSRTALHAATISFLHPVSAAPLSFQAPYPPDFVQALRLQV
jgi:tRNA pseudouridine32 synthase / 23S rRNA pseudouridine746 synthase